MLRRLRTTILTSCHLACTLATSASGYVHPVFLGTGQGAHILVDVVPLEVQAVWRVCAAGVRPVPLDGTFFFTFCKISDYYFRLTNHDAPLCCFLQSPFDFG